MVAGLRIPGSHVTKGDAMVIIIASPAATRSPCGHGLPGRKTAAWPLRARVHGIRRRIHACSLAHAIRPWCPGAAGLGGQPPEAGDPCAAFGDGPGVARALMNGTSVNHSGPYGLDRHTWQTDGVGSPPTDEDHPANRRTHDHGSFQASRSFAELRLAGRTDRSDQVDLGLNV